jgi:broad specificity phosphatase PhoE
MPAKIMLVRHAEKPIADRVQGVRARGVVDAASLSPAGWQRAGALVAFFARPTSIHISRPDHLIAVRFDRADAKSSRRSAQTIKPLSRMLGLPIDVAFGEEQGIRMVEAVMKLDGVVLIAWSHGNIPRIAEAIGPGLVKDLEWPEERFDLVWVFEQKQGSFRFVQVPQLLAAGDSEAVIRPKPSTQRQ